MRARDLGLSPGRFPTGPDNAITDVTGVRVGHVTLIEGDGPLHPANGPVRTGVTALLPASDDVFDARVLAGSDTLNGAGEVTGLHQLREWGLCETPILLTSTMNVGRVADAVVTWMWRKHPRIGAEQDVILPVVAECDDSFLTDAIGRHVGEAQVFAALDGAKGGPVPEGCVGAGTGMQTFNFAGGIGTSSRRVSSFGTTVTLGALVLSNFGERDDMRIEGMRIGQRLAQRFAHIKRRPPAGSIIVLMATDAPLSSRQLGRLAKRGGLALGRLGNYAANDSGELMLAWSTANRVPRTRTAPRMTAEIVLDGELDPLFEAAVDAVEEAVLNALCAGVTMTGRDGHTVPALPVDEVQGLLRHRPG